MTIQEYLNTYKILIFSGNGGTGKTTLSAAWAMEAAERGKNVGLITIDPSRRLGDAFGMDVLKQTWARKTVGSNYVDIFLIDSEKTIKDFVLKNFSEDFYQKLTANKLFGQVSTILSENQSVSTIYKLVEMIDSKDYDVIVVDTPPSNHAVDFFRSPQDVFRIFEQNLVAKAILEAKGLKFWSSKKLFVKVLSYLTGEEFVREMEAFFLALFSFQEYIVKSAQRLQSILKSDDVCLFSVSLPESDKIREMLGVARELAAQNIKMQDLVINRSHPYWFDIQKPVQGFASDAENFRVYSEKLWEYYKKQRDQMDSLLIQLQGTLRVHYVPESPLFQQEFRLSTVQEMIRGVFG